MRFEGNILFLHNQQKVRLDYPIAEVLDFRNMIFVGFKFDRTLLNNENVIALDQSGKLIWEIEKREHYSEESPYVSMSAKGDQLVVHNYDGTMLSLDPHTGNVIDRKWMR